MTSRDGLFTSALELRARIRTRELSSAEVTAAVLQQIADTQPTLNTFITLDADNAMRTATEADKAVARGDDLGPLHGIRSRSRTSSIPRGLRTTWGSRLMADNVPDADAVAVARLKQAGAIIVGKTTTSSSRTSS